MGSCKKAFLRITTSLAGREMLFAAKGEGSQALSLHCKPLYTKRLHYCMVDVHSAYDN